MVYAFADYELDPDRFELRRAGAALAIEPQVFDVLLYLVDHRDRVVTKNELLDNIWGDRFVSESALTSRIKAARRLLGDDGKSQLVIKTAHGRGYRFAAPVVERDGAGSAVGSNGGHSCSPSSSPTTLEPVRPPPPPWSAGMSGTWPIVGRHVELERIAEWFADPGRGGVLLVGAAGLGKTRLAEEVVAAAAAAGLPTARAAGHAEAQAFPLAAFAHLVPLETIGVSGDAQLDRATLFHRSRAALAAEQRRLLFVDDVDLLDELSRALLTSLISDRTVFGVLTMRAGRGPVPAVERLVKDGHVERIDLDALAPETVEALLHLALGGPVVAQTTEQLVEASLGNPGIVRQLVEASIEAGSLRCTHGVWELTGAIRTSPTLEALVADRLDVVGDGEQHAVELLAVAGELGLDLLAGITGDAPVEELERIGVVRCRTDGRREQVGLAHPLFGEIVRHRMPTLRARRLRRQLADALDGFGARRREDRIRIVAWQLDAGGDIDVDLLVETAQLALLGADLDTAGRLLGRALEVDASPRVLQMAAELEFRRGDAAEVERLLGSIDVTQLDDRHRVQIARRRANNSFFANADYRDAVEIVERELQDLRDPVAIGSLEAFLSLLLTNGGQVRRAIERAESALPTATGGVKVELLRSLSLAQVHAARPLLGLELAREGQALRAELERDVRLPGMSMLLFVEVVALTATGDVEAARDAARRVKERYPDALTNWIDTAIGRLELMAGRTAAARRALTPGIHHARAHEHGQVERWVLALHACTHLLEGRPDRAAPELERVASLEDEGRALYHPEIDRAHAWMAAAEGDLARARELLLASAADCDERGAAGMVSLLLHDVARFGDPGAVAARLAEIAAHSDGELFACRAEFVAGVAENDPARISRAADAFERGGARVYAAEAAAATAVALRAAGRHDEADAARTRAEELRHVAGVRLVTPALERDLG
jgi:DNA-binding winged helix-turn-helix (wHTH) protein/tetratricopeptide (TPR) repeat protein